jgi:hypothetical protein
MTAIAIIGSFLFGTEYDSSLSFTFYRESHPAMGHSQLDTVYTNGSIRVHPRLSATDSKQFSLSSSVVYNAVQAKKH